MLTQLDLLIEDLGDIDRRDAETDPLTLGRALAEVRVLALTAPELAVHVGGCGNTRIIFIPFPYRDDARLYRQGLDSAYHVPDLQAAMRRRFRIGGWQRLFVDANSRCSYELTLPPLSVIAPSGHERVRLARAGRRLRQAP